MINNIEKLRELGKDLTVLYVEDNKELREAFSIYLKKFFKKVSICTDGKSALEEYKQDTFDIVITDINMPNIDGLEMSQEIKKINDEQRIIIISAYKNVDSYAEAIRVGVDGYILKPIEFQQVNSILVRIGLYVKNSRENREYRDHLEELVEAKTQEIKKYYVTDGLTGLPNRVELNEKLSEYEKSTVILLNIDNFSIINYNFGFMMGDEIIKKTAEMLQSFEDGGFTLFRMQADEFVFLSPSEDIEKAKTLAETIKKHFTHNNVLVELLELNLSFTIAIDSGKKRDLLRTTSLTIQEVRQIGKNHIGLYNENSHFEELQKNNLIWIEKIKSCFIKNKFIIYFQAIKNIKTGKIEKYEVLSRVLTDDNKIEGPYMFLKPLALAGLLTDFTKNVIDMAFAFIQDKETVITINITGEDFRENYLVGYIEEKRKEYGIDSSHVVLEILESISTIDSNIVLEQLRELKALGYKLAIDDFGTENSNFSRLLTLKVDFIKIDGSFIKNIVTDKNAQEIVKTILLFAHNMDCEVIAEFVHNKEVYELISEYGIDYAQGYFISEPKPELLEDESC